MEALRLQKPRWMPFRVFLALAERKSKRLIEKNLRHDYPHAHERLLGIAEGAGKSPGTLFLMNALEAFMSDVSGSTCVPVAAACSALAVRGSRSATGYPVIARNFDYIPTVRPYYVLRETRPTGGLRSLDFTMAPLAGAVDGVNEAGLCITYNYAFTTDRSAASTPISLSIGEALARCRTVQEAAEWISSRPRWGGGILMLADESGDIASLELSRTRSRVVRPDGPSDVLFHTNCFAGSDMCRVEVLPETAFDHRAPIALRGRVVLQSAIKRRQRFTDLVADHRRLGLDDLEAILSDHGADGLGTDDTICMHGSYWQTTATLQLLPRERKMRVSYSSACQARFTEVGLN